MKYYPTDAIHGPRHANDFGKVRSPRAVLRELAQAVIPQVIAWEVTGIDVSSWNGTMDWAIAKSRGISFAYIRAGYGNSAPDVKMNANRDGCAIQDLAFGLYWYLYVGRTWKDHATSFYNAWHENPGQLPPWMDCETTTLDTIGTLNWIYNCAAEFEQRAGVPIAFYSSPGWWNGHVKRSTWAGTKKLAVAHWTNLASPILPYDWTAWKFWQHSANGNGFGRYYGSLDGDLDMDLDRYNGSLSNFYTEFGVQPPVDLEQRVDILEREARLHGWNLEP